MMFQMKNLIMLGASSLGSTVQGVSYIENHGIDLQEMQWDYGSSGR